MNITMSEYSTAVAPRSSIPARRAVSQVWRETNSSSTPLTLQYPKHFDTTKIDEDKLNQRYVESIGLLFCVRNSPTDTYGAIHSGHFASSPGRIYSEIPSNAAAAETPSPRAAAASIAATAPGQSRSLSRHARTADKAPSPRPAARHAARRLTPVSSR
jgi:hypothetical protein